MAKAAVSKGITILEFDNEAIRSKEQAVQQETDQQIVQRLSERFEVLNDMARAVKSGTVRAMIVSGPPGVGKSYGIETVLEKDDLFTKLADKKPKYEVVKGNMSALGLYAKLYEFSEKGNVVVFDDCDAVLMDELSLNILKGALDSSERRWISWNTDSRMLRQEGIPDRFEFKGSAIFITNIKFSHVKSKKLKDHLAALESRCHYIDLEMDTTREKILWIKHIVEQKDMLARYEFEPTAQQELIDYVDQYKEQLRELSLRMVLKLADLRKSFPTSWQAMKQDHLYASMMTRVALYATLGFLLDTLGASWNSWGFWCTLGLFISSDMLSRREGFEYGCWVTINLPKSAIDDIKQQIEDLDKEDNDKM